MFSSWLCLGIVLFLSLIPLFLTVLFCFWSVYLLDAIQRKWKVYKHALRCIQQGGDDSLQQMLAYDSKTEFVKFVFLFFMNLVEWLGSFSAFVACALRLIQEFPINSDKHQANDTKVHIILLFSENSQVFYWQNLYDMPNILFVLSLLLVASLCMYLSERFAKVSWIKSDRIPCLIVSFLVFEIVVHILGFFCLTHIISLWCEKFSQILALLIAFKQYRKLMMIMNWSILDLKVSNNNTLVEKQVKMKEFFTKVFKFIWIGVVLLIASQIMETISLTLMMLLWSSPSNSSRFLFFCENPHRILKSHIIFKILHLIGFVFSVFGFSILTIPYIAYGLYTMCVILWRLARGKTGFKTHFGNTLHTSLI